MTYTIYRRWTPDGRSYIGSTTKTLEERSGKHGEFYATSPRFYQAIQEWGWKNIKSEILLTTDDLKVANQAEKDFILEFRSNEPEYGYNSWVAGNTNDSFSIAARKKYKPTELTKQLISRKRKEYWKVSGHKESIRGELNVSKRPDVKKKISEKIRLYRSQPEVKSMFSKQRTGTIQISKTVDGEFQRKQIPSSELEYYLSLGWTRGWEKRAWIHRSECDQIHRKMILCSELNDYLESGWKLGSGRIHRRSSKSSL